MRNSPKNIRFVIGNSVIEPGRALFFIAGPCVIESEEITLEIARELARISSEEGVPIIFKASYDKANRTSIDSYRGPGQAEGLRILSKIKQKTGMPLLSDIHTPDQAEAAARVLDIIQIPAFLSRQTDLLVSAARTQKIINLKKGQTQSPDEMKYAVNKIVASGNDKIWLTERGASFGYNDLVADMRSIVRMQKLGAPVVFDATHSAQFPGKDSDKSGGDRSLAPVLARAAVAAGADGIFMEVHPDPNRALCDGPNSLRLEDARSLIKNLKSIYSLIPKSVAPEDSRQSAAPAPTPGSKLFEKLKKIKLIIFDVDGVLTPGGIIFGSGNLEIKYFHVRDGHGIKIAKRSGLEIAFVTGRSSDIVDRRAQELGVDIVYQGMKDKRPAVNEIMSANKLSPEQIAVVGDDVVDIPMMRMVGLGITVQEAPDDVIAETAYVTRAHGGEGVAREIIEMILKAQGKWSKVMERYYV